MASPSARGTSPAVDLHSVHIVVYTIFR